MRQGRNNGVQSDEASDITVWIILYISTYDYVISFDMKYFLYNKFSCQKLGKGYNINV